MTAYNVVLVSQVKKVSPLFIAGSQTGRLMMPDTGHGKSNGGIPCQDHRAVLQTLLGFDPKIRTVVEVGFGGERIAFASRKGLESLEPESETTRVLDQTAIGAGMGASANRYHGRVKAVIVARERLSLIIFPLFDSLILVSADPEFPLEKTRQMGNLLDTTIPDDPEAEQVLEAPTSSRKIRGDLC